MASKELNARGWAEWKGVSYKQTLRWLADPKIRASKFPGAHQMKRRGTWFIPLDKQLREPAQNPTVEEIVIEEDRKQAVLTHLNDLRTIAGRWKSELWLPPPWQWDVAHLESVFYMDRAKQTTGYKMPVELLDSEQPQGQFRHFERGCVYWTVQEDGAIVLKLTVEDEATFGYLKAHTQESPAWGLFAKWKEEGSTYIQYCSSLLAMIEQDTKRAIGTESELSWWAIYHDAFCTRETMLRCETCGAENPSAFVCPICNSKFSQVKELELHIRRNHPGADPTACSVPCCQNCNLPLGWLRPLLKEYKRTSDDPRLSPIHIRGWGNIEDSIEVGKFEGITRGHAALKNKYIGCTQVEAILEREKTVAELRVQLSKMVESISQQKVFSGKCLACPGY